MDFLAQKGSIPINGSKRARRPTKVDSGNFERVFVFGVELINERVHHLQVFHPHDRLVRPQREQRVRPEADDTCKYYLHSIISEVKSRF